MSNSLRRSALPHGADFANYYDLLYSDKDYATECELFDRMVQRFATGTVRSVLDAGCGTGGHSLRLAELGYRVCGVDRSEAMLSVARSKPQPPENPVDWVQQDLLTLDLGRRFDACGSFFAVLSFQLENRDMASTLANLHRHLEPGGLLLADLWYGPAVLIQGTEKREKTISTPELRLVKQSTPELDTLRHTNVVHQHVTVSDAADRVLAEFDEAQEVRFWFPQELVAFLERAGFEVLSLFAYPDPERPPHDAHWDLGFVARAGP